MRKFFKNPDFSLTKFVLTIVFTAMTLGHTATSHERGASH